MRDGAGESWGPRQGHGALARSPSAAPAVAFLVVYGVLVLVAAFVGVRREAGLPTAPSWSVLHLVVVMALTFGLHHAQRWAWWGALAFAGAALLGLVPVTLAVLGGPGITVVLPRFDLMLVTGQAVALILLLGQLLRMGRP